MTPSDAQKIILALAAGVDPDTGQLVEGASPLSKLHVVRALVLAARALGANVQETTKVPLSVQRHAGAAWTSKEDEALLRAFDNGADVTSLAEAHGRTPGAIESRLAKHGRASVGGADTSNVRADSKNAPVLDFKGIKLYVDWTPQSAASIEELPTCAGVYAEIHWPKRGVRIGETGASIQGKILHDIRWFKGMHDGTESPDQLRRTIPIAMTAKEHGASGFAFYVISDDERLRDKQLRQDCERHLFKYVEQHPDFDSWNHQKTWR